MTSWLCKGNLLFAVRSRTKECLIAVGGLEGRKEAHLQLGHLAADGTFVFWVLEKLTACAVGESLHQWGAWLEIDLAALHLEGVREGGCITGGAFIRIIESCCGDSCRG